MKIQKLMNANLPIFEQEDFLTSSEANTFFALGSSDIENWSMFDILEMADEECKHLWGNIKLGYGKPRGMPLLIEEIAKQYADPITSDNILCFAGAQEGIFAACHSLLTENDHAIVITPCYQALEAIPASICSTTQIPISHNHGWQLSLKAIHHAIRTNTKLLLINFPHNPTGAIISHETQKALVEIAKANNMWIFSDEVSRLIELDPKDQLPPIADLYDKGISLGVMSQSYGLSGLRVGWIATQNQKLLHQISDMKHYLSICNSTPSEILALIALRNQETILKRNLAITRKNIAYLEEFINANSDIISWVPPKGGCTCFPKLNIPLPAYDFCEQLRASKGVCMLPNTVYFIQDNHIRIGYGRKRMPEALDQVTRFIKNDLKTLEPVS